MERIIAQNGNEIMHIIRSQKVRRKNAHGVNLLIFNITNLIFLIRFLRFFRFSRICLTPKFSKYSKDSN